MRRGINPYNRADEIFLSFPRQFFGANDFISQFGTNLVYTAAFDPRIGSRRGTVTHAEGTYVNPVVRLLRDSDSSYRSFDAQEVVSGVMTNWVNEDVVIHESDCATTNGWVVGSASSTLTANYDSGDAGHSSVFRIEASDGIFDRVENLGVSVKSGNTYRLQLDYKMVSGIRGAIYFGNTQLVIGSLAATTWTSLDLEVVATGDYSNFNIYVSAASGSATDEMLVDNIQLTALTANGLIHTAYDPSGNGNDATQTTVANMPKLVDAGVLVTDALGNVAGLFDEPDYLDALSTFSIVDAFVVIEYSSSASIYPAQAISTRAAAAGMSMEIDASGNLISRIFGTLGNTTSPNIFAEEDVSQLHYAHCENANFYSSVNGNITTTNTTNVGYVSESPTPLRIGELTGGGGGGFVGKIAAIFIFNADMSAQRPAIEAALANIYGISL